MGQVKKLDIEGFKSRVDGGFFGGDTFSKFIEADKKLVEADKILSECGIEGIAPLGYSSRETKISQLYDDVCLLINYPYDLQDGLIGVDERFSHGVQNALNALSTIKIDDIRISNNLGAEIIQHYEENAPTEIYPKEYLTLADFVGSFDGLKSQETTYVKGFTDLLYSPYITEDKDLQAIVAEKSDEIHEILYGAEFNAKKYQPGRELLSEVVDTITVGTYSVAIAILGYDPITKEILTEEERNKAMISGLISAGSFAFTMGTSSGAAERVIAYLSSVGGDTASILASEACEYMGASELETMLLSYLTGMAVGYTITKGGETCLEYFRKNEKEILEDMGEQAIRTDVSVLDNGDDIVRIASGGDSENALEIITDGSHLENGRLKPNVTYSAGEHNYIYTTNEDGLIVSARTDNLQFKTHEGRLNHNPNTYGKEANDHAGHLFGDRFGGSPELDNLVSQAKEVNLSEYKKIENIWANALENGQTVTVDIRLNYDIGSMRPTSFDINYSIDGIEFQKLIFN